MTGSGSIGLPCPGVSIRLVDEQGEEVGVDEPGEVLIKAPGMMRGYLNRPDATAEALSDGWLHSGDLARRDESGYLYFLGRKKDIVRRAGENVAAAEVEDVLRSHPEVLEAAVVAVPDELRGEEVKAYVALVEDAICGGGNPVTWLSSVASASLSTRSPATSSTEASRSRARPRCG